MKEGVWNLPGSDAELIFDEELIQRHLDGITRLLTALVEASLDFFDKKELKELTDG